MQSQDRSHGGCGIEVEEKKENGEKGPQPRWPPFANSDTVVFHRIFRAVSSSLLISDLSFSPLTSHRAQPVARSSKDIISRQADRLSISSSSSFLHGYGREMQGGVRNGLELDRNGGPVDEGDVVREWD